MKGFPLNLKRIPNIYRNAQNHNAFQIEGKKGGYEISFIRLVIHSFIAILFVCVIAFDAVTTQAIAPVFFILVLSLVFVTDIYVKKELM